MYTLYVTVHIRKLVKNAEYTPYRYKWFWPTLHTKPFASIWLVHMIAFAMSKSRNENS